MIGDIPAIVINLPERTERLERCRKELASVGIDTFTLIPGVKDRLTHRGIGQAHINAIRYAKDNEFPAVIIIEDDVVFQGKDKTIPHINECLLNTPQEWDILLSGVYFTHGQITFNDHWNMIGEFAGLHFYIVNSSAYDKILLYDGKSHIDRWMGKNKGLKKYVAKKYFATQLNGFSDNTGKIENYQHMIPKNRLL